MTTNLAVCLLLQVTLRLPGKTRIPSEQQRPGRRRREEGVGPAGGRAGRGTWLSALRAALVAGKQWPDSGDRSRHGEPRTAPSEAEGAGRRDLNAHFSAGNRTTVTTGSGRNGGISRLSVRLPGSRQSRVARMRSGHRNAALFVQSPAAAPYRLALSCRYQQMRGAQRLRGQSATSRRVEPVPRRGSARRPPSGQHQPPQAGRSRGSHRIWGG